MDPSVSKTGSLWWRFKGPYSMRLGSALLFMLLVGHAGGQASVGPFGAALPTKGEAVKISQFDVEYTDYRFRDGTRLPKLRLHYATIGTPHANAAGRVDNAVLMLHWTGASGKALLSEEYQRALYAPGAPLDSRRYFLIIPDNLGHGESSKPSDGLRTQFPQYGYRDLVDLQHKLVTETLHIDHLHAIVGMSMGGMNAWQWAEQYPCGMDGIMPVVSLPARIAGRNLLWRQMAANWIKNDPAFDGGNYTDQPKSLMMSYELIRLMIDGVPHLQKAVPDLDAARQFLHSVDQQAFGSDANDLVYSLQSSSDYSPEEDLGKITTKVYALNFSDDEFNPVSLHLLENAVAELPAAHFAIQDGTPDSYGHLTMAHPQLWSKQVAKFMQLLEGPQR